MALMRQLKYRDRVQVRISSAANGNKLNRIGKFIELFELLIGGELAVKD